jgi:hypothetical protein
MLLFSYRGHCKQQMILIFTCICSLNGQYWWPCDLKLKPRSAAAQLAGSQVQILLREWMFVLCVCMCCISGGFWNKLITHSEESYWMCVSKLCETLTVRWPRPHFVCCATEKIWIELLTLLLLNHK